MQRERERERDREREKRDQKKTGRKEKSLGIDRQGKVEARI